MVSGRSIGRTLVHRPDVLRQATPDGFVQVVSGRIIDRVWRRAKMVVIDLRAAHASGGHVALWHMVVQPRFTGGLVVNDGSILPGELKTVCVSMTLDDGRELHYRDVRRLGTVALMSANDFAHYAALLGPEPLDPALTAAAFKDLLSSSRQFIKVALMDQHRLAGVGNIYAAEALWRARLDPSREARSLSGAEMGRLLETLREVLTASTEARGTSFRDFRDARGERGGFVPQLAVYGRGGEPCLRCGRRLVATHAIDGRGTVFCAGCQF